VVQDILYLMDHLDCMGKEQVLYSDNRLDYKVEELVLGDIAAMAVDLDNLHSDCYMEAEAVVALKDILRIADCSEVVPVVDSLHCFVVVVVVVAEDILHHRVAVEDSVEDLVEVVVDMVAEMVVETVVETVLEVVAEVLTKVKMEDPALLVVLEVRILVVLAKLNQHSVQEELLQLDSMCRQLQTGLQPRGRSKDVVPR